MLSVNSPLTCKPDHLGVGGGVESRLQETHGRDGGAVVVQGREEAVVAAHVEHVDQPVTARGRQQAVQTTWIFSRFELRAFFLQII